MLFLLITLTALITLYYKINEHDQWQTQYLSPIQITLIFIFSGNEKVF